MSAFLVAFIFADFCSYLLVLDIFRHFDSWHTALLVHRTLSQNDAKIHKISSKIHPQIYQNGTQERSERLLGPEVAKRELRLPRIL
jgi:hypothetical protein